MRRKERDLILAKLQAQGIAAEAVTSCCGPLKNAHAIKVWHKLSDACRTRRSEILQDVVDVYVFNLTA